MSRRLVQEERDTPSPPRADTVRIPHDAVNEQVILSAALLSRDLREKLVTRVRPDSFLVKEHVDAWIAISELVRNKLEYDPDTIRQLSGGKVDVAYLDQLIRDRQVVPANINHHVGLLEYDRQRMEAVRGPLSQLLEALRDPSTPPDRTRALAKSLSNAFSHGTTSTLLREPTAIVESAIIELRARKDRACYPYGINGLDYQDDRVRWRMIPGAAPGKVTVLTGVPGSGKSTVAARIALAQANAGRRVLYGAWEMGDENTLELLAGMSLGMSRYRLSTGAITPDEEAALVREMERLSSRIRFVGVPGAPSAVAAHQAKGERATNERTLDQLHAVLTDTGADVFIADLWKRCLRQTDPDEEEQALIRQQAIAAATKCHCFLLQQQRLKDIESRLDKRPTREGIKGSGAWVEIADTIVGVHRPALWKNVDDVTIELDVLKQRWGPWPMAVEFDWDSDKGSITGGKTVDYDSPSGDASQMDEFLAPAVKEDRRKNRARKQARG